MNKEVGKEEKFNKFLEELLKDSSPDYRFAKGNEELLESVELSLFLKKEQLKDHNEFKSRLYRDLSKEFVREFKERKNITKILFSSTALSAALLMFFMLFRPVGVLYTPVHTSSNNAHDDIVRVASYNFGNRKTLRILYNEKNRAILYWPIGQFAIFQ